MLGIQDITRCCRLSWPILRVAKSLGRVQVQEAVGPFCLVCFVACSSSSQKDLLLGDPDASFIAAAGPVALFHVLGAWDWSLGSKRMDTGRRGSSLLHLALASFAVVRFLRSAQVGSVPGAGS